jgi:membrane fusion protein (multidrug efflux system)
MVASEVEGVVEVLAARDGDRVQKGQALVKLRRTNLHLRMQAVRGQLKEAEARQSLAQTSMTRSQGLFDEKIISQQQLDDAISEFEAWQGRVEQLQAEVARLEDDLSRTTVRAPFSGIVVREMVAEGEWLGSGDDVVELLDFEDLEVTVEVPEGSF